MVSSARSEVEEISTLRPRKTRRDGDRKRSIMSSDDLARKSMRSLSSGGPSNNQIDSSGLVEDLCNSKETTRTTAGIAAGESGSGPSANCTDGGEERKAEVEPAEEWRKGWISVIGRRRAMEDAVALEEFGPYRFFAVYDGHGGSAVANACRARLHHLVEEVVDGRGGGVVEWEKTMTECFRKMDDEVCGESEDTPATAAEEEDEEDMEELANTVGSTAVVVVVGEALVVVANCGDSRAVLCRDGAAVPLSRDHKPDRPDEKERVEAAGGRVINWNGFRVFGILAISRSIGDHYLKPYVISEPEVTVWERTELDRFLVIASDGLWDVMSNDFACDIVRRCFEGQMKMKFSDEKILDRTNGTTTASEASALLAELAIARGSKDNISVVVVDLK